jgi:hypothetical protein
LERLIDGYTSQLIGPKTSTTAIYPKSWPTLFNNVPILNPISCSLKLDNSKKMKAFQLFFITAILAMAVVNTRAWQEGDGGLVSWDHDCDFNDPTFATFDVVKVSAERCGRACIDREECKYFVARDGWCWLKNGPGGQDGSAPHKGATCGFVNGRITSTPCAKLRCLTLAN